jgi:hypothetical protein
VRVTTVRRGFAEPAGVAYGVARERAVPHGECEHLAEHDFHALGRGGPVPGNVAEQPVETPDAGLSNTQVTCRPMPVQPSTAQIRPV